MTSTIKQALPGTVDDFFCKDIPEPFQILGLKLLPLSIGRYRRMARHGVAFVSDTAAKADGKDLLLGVLICSMSCRAWDALSITNQIPKVVSQWMKQINASPPWYLRYDMNARASLLNHARLKLSESWVGWRWRKNNSFDLLEKCTLFKRYIDEAQRIPRHIIKSSDGGSSSSHWSHNIEVVLRSNVGWTRDEIEERPLSNAIADYFKYMENEGAVTILTEQDFSDITANDEIIKAALKGVENGL